MDRIVVHLCLRKRLFRDHRFPGSSNAEAGERNACIGRLSKNFPHSHDDTFFILRPLQGHYFDVRRGN